MNPRLSRALLAVLAFALVGACSCNEKKHGTGDGGSGDGGGQLDGSADGGSDAGDSGVVTPCGNGTLDSGEACDDHNAASGDGCSSTCAVEPGWDCSFSVCLAAQCGDGLLAGAEGCDDGNKTSGDGCSIRCTLETGWVCVTPGFPCRKAVCGDRAVEANEQCDDGGTAPNDGCSATCQLEAGYYCPTPGSACVTNTCGDSMVHGLEQCDDGDAMGGDGCSTTCQLEPGYTCPTPGQMCVASTCGDGAVQGLEACDDHGTAAGDGCSPTCAIEPFYACSGSPSVCKKPVEFVRIAKFVTPMQQTQAVHYDPRTRSFVAYDFNSDANRPMGIPAVQEVCLDGTFTNVRKTQLEARRSLIGDKLDGAAYDAFHDTFLFVTQAGRLYEIDRNNNLVQPGVAMPSFTQLTGLGTAGGVQVGDDGRIYATNHFYPAPANSGPGAIRVFGRNANGSVNPAYVQTLLPYSQGTYLDNLFVIPGLGWIGYYNDFDDLAPPADTDHTLLFAFQRYDGSLVGASDIPGVLFRNGEHFPGFADGGEAAVDGGYFLVCSEYRDRPEYGGVQGFCQLFAQTCETDLDCATRVPGTVCKTSAATPYCYSPAVARDDFYSVPRETMRNLTVLDNDSFADAVCLGNAATITAVTTGDHGGTIAIHAGGSSIDYTPATGQCGFVESFTYTADLGGGATDMAAVHVTVPCVCGNGLVEAGEQCDDNNTTPGDGCSATCQNESVCGNGVVEAGEQCDDHNTLPGDGCSPNCTYDVIIE